MKPLLIAVVMAVAAPALAEGPTDMTATERDAFRAEVRAYLMENPEVLMEAIGVLEQRQAEALAMGDAALVAAEVEALTEDGNSWTGGNPDGDVTVVEFLDYRCGYCRRAYPEVTELIESDGNIRLIVKEFPILGEQSVMASQFAIATLRVAGHAAYAAVHEALMTLRGDVTEDSLRTIAEDTNLDADAVMAEMASPEVGEIISANRALAQRLNINGTPGFVFEDQLVRGYVPLDGMREIVEAARADG